MLAFARRALERIDAPSGVDVVVLTARASTTVLDAWPFDPKSPCFSWFPGDLARSFDPWRMIGEGETLRVDANGEGRWHRVRESARALSGSVLEMREENVAAPPLRWFGGGSFHPSLRDPMWSSFGNASFVMPRWTIGARGDDAFVRFAFRVEELDRKGDLLDEIEAKLAARTLTSARAGSAQERTSAPPDADESWTPLVLRALADIEAGTLQKVVVARRAFVSGSFSPVATLARLRSQNPQSTAFSFRRGDATFLGATPERLIFSDKTRAFTEALAGTVARRADDERAKRELLASEKDLHEHRIVALGITRALAPFVAGVDHGADPAVRTLGRVHHLVTPIVARLASATHVLSLVDALHPTPALSGLPKSEAFEWIATHERFDRGWYGAPVGWFDDAGEGAFAVAIRSALVTSDRTWLFAGSGIVRGSRPDAELAETQLKLATMSEALVHR